MMVHIKSSPYIFLLSSDSVLVMQMQHANGSALFANDSYIWLRYPINPPLRYLEREFRRRASKRPVSSHGIKVSVSPVPLLSAFIGLSMTYYNSNSRKR